MRTKHIYLFLLLFAAISCTENIQHVKEVEKTTFFTPLDANQLAKFPFTWTTTPKWKKELVNYSLYKPSTWITENDVSELTNLLSDNSPCQCYVSPFSSTNPTYENEYATVAGLAALYLKAVEVDDLGLLGSFNCPKSKEEVAQTTKNYLEYNRQNKL